MLKKRYGIPCFIKGIYWPQWQLNKRGGCFVMFCTPIAACLCQQQVSKQSHHVGGQPAYTLRFSHCSYTYCMIDPYTIKKYTAFSEWVILGPLLHSDSGPHPNFPLVSGRYETSHLRPPAQTINLLLTANTSMLLLSSATSPPPQIPIVPSATSWHNT